MTLFTLIPSAYFKRCLCLLALVVLKLTWAQTLPFAVENLLDQSKIPRENVSLWIAPVDTGQPIVNWQSHILRTPASVTKMLTTGVGLLTLGENYRWRTEFFTDGQLHNGVLKGDLLIKGHGNPYLVEEDMQSMVQALRARGMSDLQGNVILDDSYFVQSVENPDAFDGHGMEPYNALPNALNINFRTLKAIIEPAAKGVSVSLDPKLTDLRVENHMRLSKSKRCKGKGFAPKFTLDRANNVLTVSGHISRACGRQALTRVVGDAGDLFYAHFKRAWIQSGGTISGNWHYGRAPKGATTVLIAQSQPLFEQIAAMNKFSNNLMARQLFLTIGAEQTQPPATLEKSRQIMMSTLRALGIDTQGLYVENGAGLSRQTRLSAAQLGEFLLAMQSTPQAPYFEQSLSVAGVDGTLKRRLRNTPLAGNAVGKTGTLNRVKSIAGYLTAASGQKFAYVVLIEDRKAKSGRPLMDALMLWVYRNF